MHKNLLELLQINEHVVDSGTTEADTLVADGHDTVYNDVKSEMGHPMAFMANSEISRAEAPVVANVGNLTR